MSDQREDLVAFFGGAGQPSYWISDPYAFRYIVVDYVQRSTVLSEQIYVRWTGALGNSDPGIGTAGGYDALVRNQGDVRKFDLGYETSQGRVALKVANPNNAVVVRVRIDVEPIGESEQAGTLAAGWSTAAFGQWPGVYIAGAIEPGGGATPAPVQTRATTDPTAAGGPLRGSAAIAASPTTLIAVNAQGGNSANDVVTGMSFVYAAAATPAAPQQIDVQVIGDQGEVVELLRTFVNQQRPVAQHDFVFPSSIDLTQTLFGTNYGVRVVGPTSGYASVTLFRTLAVHPLA